MGPGSEVTRKRKEILAVRVLQGRRVIIRAESRKFVRFHGEFSYFRGSCSECAQVRASERSFEISYPSDVHGKTLH